MQGIMSIVLILKNCFIHFRLGVRWQVRNTFFKKRTSINYTNYSSWQELSFQTNCYFLLLKVILECQKIYSYDQLKPLSLTLPKTWKVSVKPVGFWSIFNFPVIVVHFPVFKLYTCNCWSSRRNFLSRLNITVENFFIRVYTNWQLYDMEVTTWKSSKMNLHSWGSGLNILFFEFEANIYHGKCQTIYSLDKLIHVIQIKLTALNYDAFS